MLTPGGLGPAELGCSGAPRITIAPSQPGLSGWGGCHKCPQHGLGSAESFSHLQTPTIPPLHNHVVAPPSPPALCQQEEVGKELGSILWPQSPGVARLLPAGKREFGEISAADVPDNTVKRQRQQGMCLPDENVLPPPPTTGLQGAVPARVCQRSGAPEFIYRTPASSCVYLILPD